jgi:hypothetical protein
MQNPMPWQGWTQQAAVWSKRIKHTFILDGSTEIKGKVVSVQVMKSYKDVEVQFHSLFNFGNRYGEWSD